MTLKEIIGDVSGIVNIEPESKFVDDLGFDSLDMIEFVMKLEDEFDIEIPDEDAEKVRTIQHAIDYLKTKGASKEFLLF